MELVLIFKTIFLGVVEGLTEFIPVSSTAHLLIAGEAVHIPKGDFLNALAVAIQSGAIIAAVWYFWDTIWNNASLIGKVAIAFIPTGVVGITLYPLISTLFSHTLIIALALIVGGIGLLFIRTEDSAVPVTSITYKQAFLIGVAQIASFIPGISRAGATLIVGSLLNIPRSLIVPFSFLLAIPTIVGAGAVELRHAGAALTRPQLLLVALGTVVAFITAFLTMKFFIKILTQKPLRWFGWYRIGVGVLLVLIILI